MDVRIGDRSRRWTLAWLAAVLVPAFAACDYGLEAGEGPGAVAAALEPEAAPPANAGQEADPSTAPKPVAEPGEDLATSARDLVQAGRFDEARTLLAEALAAMPGDAHVVTLLSALEMIEENYESVADLADQALATEPGSVPFLETRAEAAFRMEDVERARHGFAEVISRLERLGRDAADVCNPLFQCCRTADEVSIGARAALATTWYEVGDLDSAERLAREILSDRPDALPAHFVLGLVLNKRDDVAGAMDEYRRVLEGCPHCSGTLNNVGVLHYRMKQVETARRYFDAAYRAAGLDRRGAAIAWSNVADLLTLQGRFDSAERTYRESLDLSPRWAGAWYGLAELFHVAGRHAEEREAFVNAMLLDERGITRFNAEYIEPEWRWQFDALLAEAEGDAAAAKALWRRVAAGKVWMLRGPARAHLAAH